jgi:GNAT superfamily N-acetyltransferase
VGYWQEPIEDRLYLKAMDAGEVFFIAVGDVDGRRAVRGFASDYRIEGQRHGSSVYVRGRSARHGIGSALLAKAEAHASETGATSIEIEASLAGVDFYRANGFIKVGRGETRLTTGRTMECVCMRNDLRLDGAHKRLEPDVARLASLPPGDHGRLDPQCHGERTLRQSLAFRRASSPCSIRIACNSASPAAPKSGSSFVRRNFT